MDFIPSNLSLLRAQLTARLAAERAHLILQFESEDEASLTNEPIIGRWTAATLLAHLALADAHAADQLFKLADGRSTAGEEDPAEAMPEVHDDALQTQFAHLTFAEAVALIVKERRGFLMALGRCSDDTLEQPTVYHWATQPYRHDAEHAAYLAQWRATRPPADSSLRVIHRALLGPLLGLAQQEFLALAALVPVEERESRPLEGEWSLKQIIGHLVEYERLAIVAIKAVAGGDEPVYGMSIPDFDAFNNSRATMWAAMAGHEVGAHYRATRRALLLVAEALPDEALARPFAAPWLETTTACGFVLDMAQHQREHSDGLRQAFNLPPLPPHLGRGA
ncbi:MAG: DinB family protein [Candidatus Promineofilum sp.]|nr:DinB family protein [Promineifilum sp.]